MKKEFVETKLNIEDTIVTDEIEGLDAFYNESVIQKTNEVWTSGKPIFREVLDFGALPNSTIKSSNLQLNHGDIDEVTDLRFMYSSGTSNGDVAFVNTYSKQDTNHDRWIYFYFEYGTPCVIKCETGRDYSSYSATVVVEYTKT